MPNPKVIEFPLGTQYNLQYHFVEVPVSSGEILAINGTPKTLVATPGAGFILMPIQAIASYTFVSAAYAGNTDLAVIHNGGTDKLLDLQNLINQVANKIQSSSLATLRELTANRSLELTELGGNPAAGDGALVIYLWYINLEL